MALAEGSEVEESRSVDRSTGRSVDAAVGFSAATDPKDLVDEIVRHLTTGGLEKPDSLLTFASLSHLDQMPAILARLRKALGGPSVVGCSTGSIVTPHGEVEAAPLFGVMAFRSRQSSIVPFSFSSLGPKSAQVAAEILTQAPKGTSHIVLFPDLFHLDADAFFRVMNHYEIENPEMPIVVGGAAASEEPGQGTFHLHDDRVMHGGLSGFYVVNAARIAPGIAQACLPASGLLEVTASEGQWITEIDGKPAYHVLRETVPEALLQEQDRLLRCVMMGVICDETQDLSPANYTVMNLAGVDPAHQVVACAGIVRPGQKVCFALRSGDGARNQLKQMLADLRTRAPQVPSAGIYFNCCARGKSLYGVPDIDSSYIAGTFPNMPFLGLSTFAEIGALVTGIGLQAYTGILLVL